jgi:light-regulated signal transduction histidine kinase (bacteriophytochrome)
MYVAILKTGLVKPYNLVFRNLKKREEELAAAKEDLEKRVRERTAELVRTNEELEQEISDHIGAEEELTRYRAHLEEMVRQRTAELEAANRELEASYKDMESFSYSASHDLREPLVIIDWFSKRLLKQYGPLLDANGKEMLSTIKDTSEKMEQLTNDLLSFARMSTKNVQKSEIDMTTLVKDVFEGMKSMVGERNVRLEIKALPPAFGDPSMIRQVLVNLLSNAIKYTRPRELARIEVGGEEREEEHRYYVRDNGIGFSGEQADRLFGFFQRLHEGKGIEGTGIGLMIIKRILEKHCGTVRAEGKIDEGATFHFSLPRNM